MRGRELQYQYQQRRNISNLVASPAATTNNLMNNQAANQTVLSAGTEGGGKPSPYLAQFVRSNYKKTGGPSLNDSLDKLQHEFMKGYNDVMQESDAAYRLDTLTQKSRKAAGPLAQMLQGGGEAKASENLELQLVKEENETLKKVIEQMKIDM